MQAAGNLVSAAAEFSSGVQNGKDDLHGGDPRLLLNIHRDAPPVVRHGNRIIRVDLHVNLMTEPGQRLVYGIVYNLIHQVMESPRGGAADVHAGTFPDRL